jgi:hypothetical protein
MPIQWFKHTCSYKKSPSDFRLALRSTGNGRLQQMQLINVRLSKIYSTIPSSIMFPELWSSIILLWTDQLYSPKITPACDAGKYASVIAYFAICILILVRIVVHTCILAKNGHQIQNQHLQFAQDQSNYPSVAYTLAEIKFKSFETLCMHNYLTDFRETKRHNDRLSSLY